MDGVPALRLEVHQSVGADAVPPVAQGGDEGRRDVGGTDTPAIEGDEVVPRAGELVEDCARLQTRPSSLAKRSRQTTQMASYTMARDILLWPRSRSVKVMGISFSRNPFRQAWNDISIWKE